MHRIDIESRRILRGMRLLFLMCLLGACGRSDEKLALERLSARIDIALTEVVGENDLSRVMVVFPPSLRGGVLCAAGPYSIDETETELLDLVGAEALKKMCEVSGVDPTRYLFHIGAQGKVSWVPLNWSIFLREHFEVSVVDEKDLVLILRGAELVGLDLANTVDTRDTTSDPQPSNLDR